jgi:sec-independent protein translocase protein TatB
LFANLGWDHLLVLLVVGLVVLGPERLPGAIRWSAGALRQARDYISGATGDLRNEFGPEFDDLREPLSELRKLRGMSPRAALTKHLLDGDDSVFTGRFDSPGDSRELTALASQADPVPAPPNPAPQPGSVPPVDTEAT